MPELWTREHVRYSWLGTHSKPVISPTRTRTRPVSAHFPLTTFPALPPAPFAAVAFWKHCLHAFLHRRRKLKCSKSYTRGLHFSSFISHSTATTARLPTKTQSRSLMPTPTQATCFCNLPICAVTESDSIFFCPIFPSQVFLSHFPFSVYLSPRLHFPPLFPSVVVISAEFRKIYFDVYALRIRRVGRIVCSG